MTISRTVRAGLITGGLGLAGFAGACSRSEAPRCTALQNPQAITRLANAFVREGSVRLSPYQERIAATKLDISMNARIADPDAKRELEKVCAYASGVEWPLNPYQNNLSLETMGIKLQDIIKEAQATKLDGRVAVTVSGIAQTASSLPLEKDLLITISLSPAKLGSQIVPLPTDKEGTYFIRLESGTIGSITNADKPHQYIYLPAKYADVSGNASLTTQLRILDEQSGKAGYKPTSYIGVVFRETSGIEYELFNNQPYTLGMTNVSVPVPTATATVTATATATVRPPATTTATTTRPPVVDDPCKSNPGACL